MERGQWPRLPAICWHPQGLGGDVMWRQHPDGCFLAVVLSLCSPVFSQLLSEGTRLLLRGAPSLSLCVQLCSAQAGLPAASLAPAALDLVAMPNGAAMPLPGLFLGGCSCEALPSCREPLGVQLRARAALAWQSPVALVTLPLQRDRLSPISQLGSAAKGAFGTPHLCHRRTATASPSPVSV